MMAAMKDELFWRLWWSAAVLVIAALGFIFWIGRPVGF
jgi:hypothetical protein